MSIAKIKPLHTHPKLSSAVLAFTLLSTALAYAQVHKSGHWSYDGDEGPSNWGDLNTDFDPCKNRHNQSPIDILNPQKTDLTTILLVHNTSPWHIIDNGT